MKIVLLQSEVPNTDLLAEVPCNFNIRGEYIHHSTNAKTVHGSIDNLKVTVKTHEVKIEGSLSKYHLGSNLLTLNRNTCKDAIMKLSDTLHLPIDKAGIKRLDVAENIIMGKSLNSYYGHLGKIRGLQRLEYKNGIEYISNRKTLSFYGKIHELKSKQELIPQEFMYKKILRYELRFLKEIQKQTGIIELTSSKLYDERVFLKMISLWEKAYFQIKKMEVFNLNQDTITDVKKLEKAIFAMGIKGMNGSEAILEMIERIRFENPGTCRTKIMRVKNKINQLSNYPNFILESTAIKELNKKIIETAEQHRQS